MRKQKIIIGILTGSLILCNTNKVLAKSQYNDQTFCSHGYETFFDHYLKSSDGSRIGTKKYFISSNFNDQQKGMIAAGIKKWDVTAYFDLASTSSNATAQIKVSKETLAAGVNGITLYSCTMDECGRPTSNYKYAKIQIDVQKTSDTKLLQKVATHEAGHALGLAHLSRTASVMWPISSDTGYFKAELQNVDYFNVVHIYC